MCVGAEAEPSSARHTPQFAAAERSTMNPKIFGRAPGTVLSMNDTMPPSRPWVIPELGMVEVETIVRSLAVRALAYIDPVKSTIKGSGQIGASEVAATNGGSLLGLTDQRDLCRVGERVDSDTVVVSDVLGLTLGVRVLVDDSFPALKARLRAKPPLIQ